MDQEKINQLITTAFAIETEAAKEAGALGYMARALVQATIPHKKVVGNEFTRRNGNFILSILAPTMIGLPYGSIPRLLISWLTTEAVLTKQRTICLGDTLSSFMQKLGLVPTGGRWGSITRLKEQTKRLFASSISCYYPTAEREAEKGFRVVDSHDIWWTPKNLNKTLLFDSVVTLSETFFNEISKNPVPIDLRILQELKKSPLALDIYCWLTYRMSYLRKTSHVPWTILQIQFGSDYSINEQGRRDFKRAFIRELKKVCILYSEAKIETDTNTLILKPSKTHIKKLVSG
jgi:hypothetical protein